MASRNPFALLSNDDASDNEQQTQKTAPSKGATIAVDAAPKGGARNGQSQQPAVRRTVPGQTTNNTKAQKEVKELPASDAAPGEGAQFEGERGRDDRGTAGRGRGRGAPRGAGDRGRGQRGGRGGRPERPDRRSQTGRVDSEKVEHQAWGGDEGKRELEAETAGVTDAAAEKGTETPVPEAATDAAPAEADKSVDKATEAPAEPEDNSKTYEEFLAEQKAAGRGVLDSLSTNARKANEGSDDSQWKDGVLVKKGETEENSYADLQKEKAQKAKKERKEKNVLEVEFQAAPRPGSDRAVRGGAPRGRGGRGGRGDGAPRGRGAPRGGASNRGRSSAQQNGLNLSDNSAFPSLA